MYCTVQCHAFPQVQPEHHSPNVWNRVEYRGLEGFIASVTPFNFTAIGANLSFTPTLMGNVSVARVEMLRVDAGSSWVECES